MIVETKLGKIEGVAFDTYVEYRRVPYAKPPVGELRWKAPVPAEPWEGVLDGTVYANRCMASQHRDDLYTPEFYSNPMFDRSGSEDCLYLNIWAPKEAQGKRLPVAFWIHGGAFAAGYATELEFGGQAYCERGVILVSVEYRCNLFGFLAHRWLSQENPEHISGNYGILDQICALTWVYDNIDAFGGDPENITVFGQSAGAMSAQTLVSSKLTKNMIAKAIMQSGGSYGTGLHNDLTLEQEELLGEEFVKLAGAASLEELRAKPAAEILECLAPLEQKLIPTVGLFLAPNIDGKVLDDTYNHIMNRGEIRDIPYMLGSTRDDIMTTPEMVAAGEHSGLYDGILSFSHKLEELGRKPAYTYYFTHSLPGDQRGAWHSSELWYMFGTLDRCWRPFTEADYALSSQMLDYWTNFMKTGDPNGAGLPEWKPCQKSQPFIREFV